MEWIIQFPCPNCQKIGKFKLIEPASSPNSHGYAKESFLTDIDQNQGPFWCSVICANKGLGIENSKAIKIICDCGKKMENTTNEPRINDRMYIASTLGPCKGRFMGRLAFELGLEGRFDGHTEYWQEVHRQYNKAQADLLEAEFQRVLKKIRIK